MKYGVIAGHNKLVPGASGNGFQEHVVARQIKDKVLYYLKQVGETAYDCTDETGATKERVWLNAAANCDRVLGQDDYIIAIHLNAGGGTGTEVYDWKGTQKGKCQAISARLSKDFGWNDRGWKNGDWIGLIKQTKAKVIYIEVCFIDNASDMQKLNVERAAIGIVEEMTGKKTKSQPAPPPSDKIYYVQVGAYSLRSNAELMAERLKAAGFPAIIK